LELLIESKRQAITRMVIFVDNLKINPRIMNEKFHNGIKVMTKEDMDAEVAGVESEHLKELEEQRAEKAKMASEAIEDQENDRLVSALEAQEQAYTKGRILDEVTEKKEEDGGEYRNS